MREDARARVLVELDGAPWRVLPVEAAARAGLTVGLELDRRRLSALSRELRRSDALRTAAAHLRRRDLTRRALDERLARRGIAADARSEALASLEHVGLVDDARVAASRARALAERGWGNEAIAFRLRGEGASGAHADAAIDALEPEHERAERIVARRGAGPATARWLAGRGFGADAVESARGWDEG